MSNQRKSREHFAQRNNRLPGVRDVAALAGVSLGTVSNFINDPRRVGSKTQIKVRQAMDELGFVPSQAAAQLRSKKSSLVGVVVPDVGNPYWASMIRGIENVVERMDLSLIVGSSRQDYERQQRLLFGFESRGVDGLVIAPIATDPIDWNPFRSRRFGAVLIEGRNWPEMASVNVDHVEGSRQIVKHLIEQGHSSIAFINGSHTVSWCLSRYEGVVKGLVEAGLDPEESLVEYIVDDLTSKEGREATDRMLRNRTNQTALVCANDLLALGAKLALQQQAIEIPRDIALAGYDDVEFAEALTPPLTTVRQPAFTIGVAAGELLLDTSRADGETREFSPHLVVRASTVAC